MLKNCQERNWQKSKNKHCNCHTTDNVELGMPSDKEESFTKQLNCWVKSNVMPQTADQRPQWSWEQRKFPYQTSSPSNKLCLGIPKDWTPGDQKNPRWQESRLHVKNNNPSSWSQRKPWEQRSPSLATTPWWCQQMLKISTHRQDWNWWENWSVTSPKN